MAVLGSANDLVSNASNIGIFPGIFLNGWLAAKYGYRPVMIVALFFLNVFIFVTFFAPSPAVLVVGQVCSSQNSTLFGSLLTCADSLRLLLGCVCKSNALLHMKRSVPDVPRPR